MKQDIAPDPVAVGRLGADGVVFTPDGISDLVEQPWGRSFHVNLLVLTKYTVVDLKFNASSINVNKKNT
jgi:hypothetical protein